jgi:epoxyqueuosine reductase
MSLEAGLTKEAAALGFAQIGIAPADAAPEAAARLRAWLEAGRHGDMLWMAETETRRSSPAALWPDVRSVIMLGTSYAPSLDPLRHAGNPSLGTISVYALGQDYHDVIKKRLKALARWLVTKAPDAQVKVFVDTAPVMEKPLAEAAGLGWQGKHTNLVSRHHGSWLFLAAIYTTLDLTPTRSPQPCCGSCQRCLTACPTNAFPAPYQLDARRCLSYLSIEYKGPIPHEFRHALGNRIYGCDDCLSVCPWNRFARAASDFKGTDHPFQPRAELTAPRLADLLALDDESFRSIFSGSPIKRIGRSRMVRNAAIAAGNAADPSLLPVLTRLLSDPDPVVAEAAAWAIREMKEPPAAGGEAPRPL